MPCNNLRGPQLTLFTGGDLGTRDSNAVREHLKNCPTCRQEAKSLDKTRSLLGRYGSNLSTPPQAPDIWSGVMGRLNQKQAPMSQKPSLLGHKQAPMNQKPGFIGQKQAPKARGPRSPQG
jgi:hypothetical protein